ncbi:MAG: toll/interleukin-1 receptor domain-containing protein [Chloroflexi bacterium]|nr:toll/interleukin-1 receptor domain-containing protein [Chloroflexota bacterium]MBI3341294.1 toll/interleukin-1 receptor domain-containing protein [Chloroflexota bacterium]
MGRIEKTVFISYRRTNKAWALFIYQTLTNHGYDVFIDFQNINSVKQRTRRFINLRVLI